MIAFLVVALLVVAFVGGILWLVAIEAAPDPKQIPAAGAWKSVRVEVGQSRDHGTLLKHMVSARIVTDAGNTLHFKWVDMREEGWEDRLAEAVHEMKEKKRTLEAANRIASE